MNDEIKKILEERFNKDSLIALATIENNIPYVRTIDAVFYEGSFYAITYKISRKMLQIQENNLVGISGEWFNGHAIANDLGFVGLKENKIYLDILKEAFKAWFDNGHNNYEDPNTIILQLKVKDGILFANGKRYEF